MPGRGQNPLGRWNITPMSKPRDGLFTRPWPLEAKRQLLTERKRALFQRLVQTLPNHIVLAQVQLLQVLNFQRGRRTQAILSAIFALADRFKQNRRNKEITMAL